MIANEEPAPDPLPVNHFPAYEASVRAFLDKPVAVQPIDFDSVVRAFVDSSEMEHEFESTLSVEDRKRVHDLASHFGLRHVTRDQDGSRILTISKPCLASNSSLRSTSSSDLILATSKPIVSHASVDDVLADTQANAKEPAKKNIACGWPECDRICKNLRGWQKHRESHK